MTTHKLGNLTIAKISKQAVLDGLSERAEQLSKQLESTLEQIKITEQELDAIDELQTESPNDPETQDPPHTLQPLSKLDLEPANHPED
ncbi:hypothetical protein KA005_24935 [bacterium]|nr:hypothetical protein [bacterium]